VKNKSVQKFGLGIAQAVEHLLCKHPKFKPQSHQRKKKKKKAECQQPVAVILATWETETRRISVQGQQIISETPSPK
jgi:hypothetical protein